MTLGINVFQSNASRFFSTWGLGGGAGVCSMTWPARVEVVAAGGEAGQYES